MIKPSDYELKLLHHLWREGRMSAREIHDASLAETRWSYSATRKTLERMIEKGLISMETMHGLKTYMAQQGKLETLAALSAAFAKDVLGLNAPLPVAAFADSPLISPAEIAELEVLLEQLSASPLDSNGDKK